MTGYAPPGRSRILPAPVSRMTGASPVTSPGTLSLLIAAALAVAAVPGPSNLFVLTRSVAHGRGVPGLPGYPHDPGTRIDGR